MKNIKKKKKYREFIFSYYRFIRIRLNYRKINNDKLWRHYEIIFFKKLYNREAVSKRDSRFKDRNCIVRLRPKLRIISVEHWESNNMRQDKITRLKTKGSFRIEVCPSGELEIPARKWD